ncbi:helix-turn-helix domain-containing protein [Ancylomarina longa]|uniref:AraC family transcriptional regulator n=1 Tax=Ancylomarina longa TaxID=2487017 RepID=A0A434AZ40_9BACT|nr:helix-turn-helix domain-containing protein [Ancylomarina longa]RUT79889.1 AraC family transcriptional regulator [Ancylomarina longa]
MNITEIIFLCAIQTVGLMVILSQKKFRTPANIFLNFILFTLLIHYAFYYFTYSNKAYQIYTPYFLSFTFISPPAIYFYCQTVIIGKLPSTRKLVPHLLLPIGMAALVYITKGTENEEVQRYTINSIQFLLASMLILYPLLVIHKLAKIYQLERFQIFQVFKYNKEKTVMIRLLVSMMLFHSLLLMTRAIFFCFKEQYLDFIELLNIIFLLVLSYVIAYHVITRPNIIHHKKKQQSLISFKQYSKSGLSEEKARIIAARINSYYQEEKVYLDPNISLKIVSKRLNIPAHHITETLNRLLGQSFNDFTNNYRVEAFKTLLQEKKYQNYSILALAFEVGFKSKATFNLAFKKFTKQTPSEYRKTLLQND